jgi:hypothetical protein
LAREAEAALTAARDALLKRAAGAIARQCGEAVGAVRGVPAMYRMSERPPPAAPSAYVKAMFAPFAGLQGAERRVGAASLREVQRRAVAALVGRCSRARGGGCWRRRFQEVAVDVVATMKKTELSLLKLQKRSEEGGGGGMSVLEKVRRQVALDGGEIARAAAALTGDAVDEGVVEAILAVWGGGGGSCLGALFLRLRYLKIGEVSLCDVALMRACYFNFSVPFVKTCLKIDQRCRVRRR